MKNRIFTQITILIVALTMGVQNVSAADGIDSYHDASVRIIKMDADNHFMKIIESETKTAEKAPVDSSRKDPKSNETEMVPQNTNNEIRKLQEEEKQLQEKIKEKNLELNRETEVQNSLLSVYEPVRKQYEELQEKRQSLQDQIDQYYRRLNEEVPDDTDELRTLHAKIDAVNAKIDGIQSEIASTGSQKIPGLMLTTGVPWDFLNMWEPLTPLMY